MEGDRGRKADEGGGAAKICQIFLQQHKEGNVFIFVYMYVL